MVLAPSFLSNLSSFKDQRVLVTGGCGFLGRHIVDLLIQCQCKEILVFDVAHPNPPFPHPSVTAHAGNLLSPSDLAPLFPSLYAVIHVASPSPTANNPSLFHSVNVTGTSHVIAACRHAHVPRLVYTSSASVVFDGSNQRNLDEKTAKTPTRTLDAYTRSKLQAEQLVLQASDPSLFTCAIRPHGIYGPRDPYLLPNIHKVCVQRKNRWQIGDGTNLVDFTYVENVAYAHLLACTQLGPKSAVNGQTYFITNRQPVLFWDFFGRMFNEIGYDAPSVPLPMGLMHPLARGLAVVKGFVPSLPVPPSFTVQAVNYAGNAHYYSCEKAVKDFGYFPAVSLEDGITRSIAAFPHLKRTGGWTEPKYTALNGSTLVYAGVGAGVAAVLLVVFRAVVWGWLRSLSWWTVFLLLLHVTLLLRFLYKRTSFGERVQRMKEKPDLTGYTAVITGSNKGIGYETALQLARLHATVILACRDVAKAELARERIVRLTNNPNVSVMQLDLSSFDSVKRMVRELQGEAMTVDLLVHNAGGMGEKGTTVDGHDRVMQSNYLSAFLLTHLLLRHSLLTPSARIVSLSSLMHQLGHVDLTDLNATRTYSPVQAYNNSKLMQVMFTFRLQRYLDDMVYEGIEKGEVASVGVGRRTAVAVHPGNVVTDFHFHFLWRPLMEWVQRAMRLLGVAKTTEQGAWPVLWAAVSREMQGVGGLYTDNCHPAVASAEARSRTVQDRLWDASMDMLKAHLDA